MNLFSWNFKEIKCSHCHQKSQGRIQTARNSKNSMSASSMFQSFFQPHGLNGENLLTPGAFFFFIFRHKRTAVNQPEKLLLLLPLHLSHIQGKIYHQMTALLPLRPSVYPSALTAQPLQIHIPINDFRGKTFGFCQHRPVLCNYIVTAKNQILSGLSFSCIGIYICTHKPCRLACNESVPILVLAHSLIAGRTVDHHSGSCQSVGNTGRARRPHVLTDLCSHHQLGNFFTLEQNLGSKWHFLLFPADQTHSL